MKKGVVIALVGPDGCGKSTIAGMLSDELQKAGISFRHQHWRPMLLPSPRVFVGQKPSSEPSQPHKAKKHSMPVSLLLASYYLTDFWCGHFFRVLPFTRSGGIFIVERFVFDMVMDPVRHRLDLPPGFISFLCRFAPAPGLIVYLSGDPCIMFERKGELGVQKIAGQMARIEKYLANYPQTFSVSTTDNTPEAVVRQVLQKMGISVHHSS